MWLKVDLLDYFGESNNLALAFWNSTASSSGWPCSSDLKKGKYFGLMSVSSLDNSVRHDFQDYCLLVRSQLEVTMLSTVEALGIFF